MMHESILITAFVETTKEREVAVIDLQGAFLHAKYERKVLMKMEEKLAELMIKMEPKIYRKYVTAKKQGKPMVCVLLHKALYRLL